MPKTFIRIKDGKIMIEGVEFKGPACIKDLDEILNYLKEKGIILEVESHEKKPEFYESVEVQRYKEQETVTE